MYDLDVMVYGPEGENRGFKRVCNKEEVNEILKYYGNTEITIKEPKDVKLSESKETCFCPYCIKMEFIKKRIQVYTCKECNNRYFVK